MGCILTSTWVKMNFVDINMNFTHLQLLCVTFLFYIAIYQLTLLYYYWLQHWLQHWYGWCIETFYDHTSFLSLNRESILFRATKTIDYVIKRILLREFISPWNIYWSTCNIWESYIWYSLWQFYGGKIFHLN